VNEQMILARF